MTISNGRVRMLQYRVKDIANKLNNTTSVSKYNELVDTLENAIEVYESELSFLPPELKELDQYGNIILASITK
jgi:hypothetical protein